MLLSVTLVVFCMSSEVCAPLDEAYNKKYAFKDVLCISETFVKDAHGFGIVSIMQQSHNAEICGYILIK